MNIKFNDLLFNNEEITMEIADIKCMISNNNHIMIENNDGLFYETNEIIFI